MTGMSKGVKRGSLGLPVLNSDVSISGIRGLEKSGWKQFGREDLWIPVGYECDKFDDIGLNNPSHVLTAGRDSEGLTVRRAKFFAVPSLNKFSKPTEAGDGGLSDADEEGDSRLVNDFLGDAIRLNFLP